MTDARPLDDNGRDRMLDPHPPDSRSWLREALRLREENAVLQENLEGIKTRLEEAKKLHDALCNPEHHPVVVTGVRRNGTLRVEVSAHGGQRLEVGVHPDIDESRVEVGASGRLPRERNCLLAIIEGEFPWTEIAEFDHPIAGSREIVVSLHEQKRRLVLSDPFRRSLSDTPLRKGDLIGFDSASGIAFSRVERPSREDMFAENVDDDDFANLGGLDPQVEEIKRAIDFSLFHPEVAAKYILPPKRCILLVGPPGNGKTRIGRCAASYIRQRLPGKSCRFMLLLGSSEINSMWYGESERNVRERFAAVEQAALEGPVVLFCDELDALGRSRGSDLGSSAPDRVLNTFLACIDGVKQLKNVILIGATNRADSLDPALVRAGRFGRHIRIPSPKRAAAKRIFELYLRRLPLAGAPPDASSLIAPLLGLLYSPNGPYAKVASAKLHDGSQMAVSAPVVLSGAALEHIVQIAAESAAAREVSTGVEQGIAAEDLAQAVHQQLCDTAQLLTPRNIKDYVSSIPQDARVVAVTTDLRPQDGPGYLRS